MGRTPEYVKALERADNSGLTGRVNRFNGSLMYGGIPISMLGVVGSAFAGAPEMALASGTAGVVLTAMGGMGYAATLPRARGAKKAGAERLQAFERVVDGEDMLDVLDRGDIDAARYANNTGFRQQDADFALDSEMVSEAEPYRLLERMEEYGDPTYLLQEDGYRFTIAAVNAPYWNSYGRNSMDRDIQSCGNYEVLEVHGDTREGLNLATEAITAEEDVVNAYVDATFS